MNPPPELTEVQGYYVTLLIQAVSIGVVCVGLVLVVLGALLIRALRS